MNAKDLKFLEMFEEFVKIDFLADKMSVTKYMGRFMDLDYLLAVDIWDYVVSTREQSLVADERFRERCGYEILNQFYLRSAVKCTKAVSITPSLRRAVYQYSKHAVEESGQNILVDLLIGNKLKEGEEILKCLLKNEQVEYGQALETILKRIFIELLKKNPAKIDLNKKLSALLLTYIKKIKTDERAMLEQRIKETQM